MANFMDYLDWRGDLSLLQSPFNEVDALILSELAYLNLDGILSGDFTPQLDLSEVLVSYERLGKKPYLPINDPKPLLQRAAESRRFSSMRLGGYYSELIPARSVQLAALCFYLEDGTVCVAFRGTDNSLVGWREDFSFCYQNHTEGQRGAAAYLDRVLESLHAPLRVCGHSKGGNLAVYAAAFSAARQKGRLLGVYANDAPGFRPELAETAEIQAALENCAVIIPESSLIGILLDTKREKTVVRSSSYGLNQHNPYYWQVRGAHFEPADTRSTYSLFMDDTIRRWMDGLDSTQRESFITALFDSLESSGALTLSELKAAPVATAGAVLSAVRQMSPEQQRGAFAVLKKLAAAGGGALRGELRRLLERDPPEPPKEP